MATHLAQISALVGFLLPLLVAVIQQSHWSESVRTIIGLVCIVIASIVTAWAEGKLNWHDWATTAITIFTLAQVSYHTVWKKTKVAPAIEKSTSAGNPSALRSERGQVSPLVLIVILVVILAVLGGIAWSPWAFLLLLVVLLLFLA